MDKHLLLALLIPALFLAATGLVKSLVKQGVFWSNFYLGIDLALTALANGIVNIVDISNGIARRADVPGVDAAGRMYSNAIVLLIAFGSLFVVMLIHQRVEGRSPAVASGNVKLIRGIWLGVVANTIGAAALITFILYRLKGLL